MEQIIVAEQPVMQQGGFDYSQLDEATAKFAWQRAQEIRWLNDSVAQSVVEMGRKLIEVRTALPDGCWGRWLDDEFAWDHSYATSLIRIARAFGDLDLNNAETRVSALRFASLASLPSSVTEEARRRLEAGKLTIDDVRDIVRQVDPDLADSFGKTSYWTKRRKEEAQQITSHAAEFQAAVRNLQVCLAEVYDPVHPRIKRAVDQLTKLIAVIMETEAPSVQPKFYKRKAANATSQYFGVSWNSPSNEWQVRIRHPDGQHKTVYVGMFTDELAAARAYDAKARELYGDKARLNFPEE